jgi:hypothetical protein
VPGLARQPYYRWLAERVTDAELKQAYRANALFDAHRDDPESGYRFLADEARAAGQPMADRTAWRICSAKGWWSVFGKKRRGKGKPGPPVHDDPVRRNFSADAPNRLWLVDISEPTPVRASSVFARSRTSTRIESSVTRSTRGGNRYLPSALSATR